MISRLKKYVKLIRDYYLLKNSELFDENYYLKINPDIAKAHVNPIIHYLRHGACEGRDPSAKFDTQQYLSMYPDVAESGVNPLVHWLRHGRAEGRRPRLEKTFKHYHSVSKQQESEEKNTRFSRSVKFSIIVALYNTKQQYLTEMIKSVQAQTYSDWELCLADGSDEEKSPIESVVTTIKESDGRIKYKKIGANLGISGNLNECLTMASGDFIALLDHDDLLHPSALYEVMKAICDKSADFVYTDEANFFDDDERTIKFVHHKPDFSVDTLRSNNYICHFTAFAAGLLKATGGFVPEYDGAQDHDLFLKLTEIADNIVHLPKVLYFWRAHVGSTALTLSAKNYAAVAGAKAVAASLARNGLTGRVKSIDDFRTIYRVEYDLRARDKVSIIIPTKDHFADLKKCIASVLSKTTYDNYEIIIVDNGSAEKELFDWYERISSDKRIKIVYYDAPFNWSALNNYAVRFASGKYYLLLNNDTEVIAPNWLEEMLMYCQRDDVGIVGAMLYYPDDTVQHAGVIVGLRGAAGHCFQRAKHGYAGRLLYAQNLSAVTGACLMIKASAYEEVKGVDESFAVAFNDVDLCLRVREKGYLVVWTPFAELYHYESKSRGDDSSPENRERFASEVEAFKARWQSFLEQGDPYYNPNLTLGKEDFSFK